MSKFRNISLIDAVLITGILATVSFVLTPVIANTREAANTANCQANLRRIGSAIKLYLSDWNRKYPTNRSHSGTLCAEVQLDSRLGIDPVTGKPYRGKFGTCWVEGLYNYIEPRTAAANNSSVWKCPSASSGAAGNSALKMTASVTYMFNFNLLEQPESVVRTPDRLMLCREFDRQVNSEARGGSMPGSSMVAATSNKTVPTCPFLLNNPIGMSDAVFTGGPVNDKLHGNGSHILFADGHVKLFSSGVFPSVGPTAYKAAWDNTTATWYNNNTPGSPYYRLIAVTP